MEKYYERKAIKNGSVRQCSKCKAKLSRYNTDTICAHCEKKRSRTKNLLQEIIDEIK
jgi:uncharacterized Zn finger protein (UPF0148 family)